MAHIVYLCSVIMLLCKDKFDIHNNVSFIFITLWTLLSFLCTQSMKDFLANYSPIHKWIFKNKISKERAFVIG